MSFFPSVASSSKTAPVPLLRRFFGKPHDFMPNRPKPPVHDPAKDVLDQPEPPKWSPLSKRSGTIMKKVGMTTLWDSNGIMIPCTVLQMEDCQVVSVRQPRPSKLGRPDHQAVQVGAFNLQKFIIDPAKRQELGLPPTRKTNEYNRKATYVGHFLKHDVTPKRKIMEFRVSDDAVLPVGAEFSVAHYVPGQFVDCQATSIGKGWAGVMKRWNFRGGNDSHGASKSHRQAGSTGGNQDPGRVFPGKKMAGRMGGKSSTVKNLLVQRIDLSMNLMFVKGCVPGPPGGVVRVTDAIFNMAFKGRKNLKAGKPEGEYLPDVATLPFPMGTPKLASEMPLVVDAAPRPLPPGSGALY